jgi:hypothetical protein
MVEDIGSRSRLMDAVMGALSVFLIPLSVFLIIELAKSGFEFGSWLRNTGF